jgi:putative pyruvate formate lyase activating enzyme
MPASYTSPFVPAYLTILPGELAQRVQAAYDRLESCDLCPRDCKVNRAGGSLGVCRTGVRARVSSYGPHYGEEYVLSGWRGSGTIFFAGCNLRCQFCQNYEISQGQLGREVSTEEIASMMLDLQARGCHNINLVSPSHVLSLGK